MSKMMSKITVIVDLNTEDFDEAVKAYARKLANIDELHMGNPETYSVIGANVASVRFIYNLKG